MSQGYQLQIDACTDALVALLSARLPQDDSYAQPVDVQESGDADFSTNGELVLKKTAVRVWFDSAKYGETRDISKTTLNASLFYQLPCRSESLRSGSESRSRSLQLTTCVMAELAGARLVVYGKKTEPIALVGVARTQDGGGIVANCYTVLIEVSGFAQFDGRNS